jgi:phage tail P2-like protein
VSGSPSSIGYGWQLFGHFPFGSSDWAEEVTWKILAVYKREQDLFVDGVPEPLRKFINALKPLLEELRFKWEQFPSLWDANRCPISNLPQLAYSVGLVDDDSKPEALRRSQILNVAQLVLNKGNDRGYQIVASLNGLLVGITPLWADDCYTDEPTDFHTTPPSEFYATFGDFPADSISMDVVFSDYYEKWPRRLRWDEPCRTAWLDLHFYTADNTDIPDFQNTVAALQQDLLRVLPIHVRIRRTTYDGPRVAGGGWTIPVTDGPFAIGGGWTIPVIGALMSTSGWTIPVVATPAP